MVSTERRVGYKPDHKSFARFLLSDQARDPAVKAAHDIRDIAEATAPRSSDPDGEATHMADEFKVNSASPPVVAGGNPRVGAEVYNSDPAAAPQEFGNARVRNPSRTLGRAGASVGEHRVVGR
jgi:hypothetical protein